MPRRPTGRPATGVATAAIAAAAVLAPALTTGCGATSSATDPGDETTAARGGLRSTLVYTRSGGLTGRTSRLTIHRDGQARLASAGKPTVDFTVGTPQRGRLARKLEAAGVPGSQREFVKTPPAPDGLGHRIRYAGGDVSTSSGADAPRAVTTLAATLSALVDRRNP